MVMSTRGWEIALLSGSAGRRAATDTVVSPLIALMKHQVDALRACGYPAAALHRGVDFTDRRNDPELFELEPEDLHLEMEI